MLVSPDPGLTHPLTVVPTDVVYSLEMNSINAVILPKEIMFANTTKVNHFHCEELDDVAISVQVRMTYRAGQHCSCRRRRCPYRVVEDCRVVELLAMTEGRAAATRLPAICKQPLWEVHLLTGSLSSVTFMPDLTVRLFGMPDQFWDEI